MIDNLITEELGIIKKIISELDEMIQTKKWINELKSPQEKINNEADIKRLQYLFDLNKNLYHNMEAKQYIDDSYKLFYK